MEGTDLTRLRDNLPMDLRPQCGAPGGNLLATAVLAILAAVQSDAAFLSWGWRIPFLLSAAPGPPS